MIDTLAVATILAALSLAEGIRRLPEGAILLRRFALGRWHVVRQSEIGMGVHLLSWCIPLSVPWVSGGETETTMRVPELVDKMHARLDRARGHIVALRILGLATLALLIGALPLAVAKNGVFGLIAVVIALLAITSAQSVWTLIVLRRTGMATGPAVWSAVKLLNPFATQRAAEMIYASCTAGIPAIVVTCDLLGPERLVLALRPSIYDLMRDREPRERYDFLTAMVAEERLLSLLRTPPAGYAGGGFCPRCGAEFSAGLTQCSDCRDVALLGFLGGPAAIASKL